MELQRRSFISTIYDPPLGPSVIFVFKALFTVSFLSELAAIFKTIFCAKCAMHYT